MFYHSNCRSRDRNSYWCKCTAYKCVCNDSVLGLKWILNDVKWRMTNRALVGIISLKFTFHLKIKSNEAKTWQKVTRNFMFHDACSFLLISSGLSDYNELYNFWLNKTSWYLILAIFCIYDKTTSIFLVVSENNRFFRFRPR